MEGYFLNAVVSNFVMTLKDQGLKLFKGEYDKMIAVDRALRNIKDSRKEALDLIYKDQPSSSRREADELASYCYEADGLIEETEHKIQGLKPPTSTSSIMKLPKNLTMTGQLNKLQKRMTELIEYLRKQEDLSPENQPLIGESPPMSSISNTNLIGRDAEVLNILEKLTRSKEKGVSIVGMRGVGKTALADHILHHKEVQAKFPLILRASMVGTTFCMKGLISTLHVVYPEERLNGYSQPSEDHFLSCGKWLLMLDGLAEVSSDSWFDFQTNYLSDDRVGRKLLITTISPQVGNIVQTTLLHLKPLSEEHCRELILQEISLSRCKVHRPSTLFALAEKSYGLPLVAKFLARLRLTEEDLLRCIREDLWRWSELKNEILPILKSSSMSLDLKLKRCFVYFFLFPHDYVFCREDLIHIWIGERLVEPHALGFELDGQLFFEELLNRSIVQPQPLDSSHGLTRYTIHKLTHDFAQIPGSKTYVRSGDECMSSSYEWDKYTCHLSLSSNKQIELSLWDKFGKNLQGLRTLLLLCNRQQVGRIGKIPCDFFEKLSGLKVLALNNTNISDLPKSIKKLKRLRYLDISHTNIKNLPENLANLSALQILKIRTGSEIPQLPVNFSKLSNLAFIDWKKEHIQDMARKQSKPKNIGTLVNLRTLPLFIVDNKEGYRITELKDMNRIQGSIKITDLQNVTDEAEAKEAKLDVKGSLKELELIWKHGSSVAEAEEVLRGLKPHHKLKELKIVGYNGVTFPQWLSNDVTQLQKLELVECQSCSNLPTIGQLPDLEFLRLEKLSKVRSLDQDLCGVPIISIQPFQSLKSFVLHGMLELQEWDGVEANIMPYLRELNIVNCPNLKNLPSFLYRFTSLVDLQIEECISLNSIPMLPTSLELLTIANCDILQNTCQDGGEHWSNIKHIPEVFVDGVKMPTTPTEHFFQNAEIHNMSPQGVIRGFPSALLGRLQYLSIELIEALHQ